MKTFTVIILAVLLSGVALAEEKDISSAPHFFNSGSIGNNSSLTMQCTGDAPYMEIDCSFVQVMVNSNSQEQKEKNRKEAAEELDKLKPNEIEKYRKELIAVDKAKLKGIVDRSTKEQNAFTNTMMKLIKNIEISKDKPTFKKAMTEFLDFSESACKISINTFDYHFTRVNKNKWLYNSGAQGLCNVVKVATIENTPDKPELWTFSQITASADEDEECKKWVEVGSKYSSSWNAPKSLMFDQCKYIEFGL